MRIDAHIDRYGINFSCSACGTTLKFQDENFRLFHPVRKGVFKKKQIKCLHVGVTVKNPFKNMEATTIKTF